MISDDFSVSIAVDCDHPGMEPERKEFINLGISIVLKSLRAVNEPRASNTSRRSPYLHTLQQNFSSVFKTSLESTNEPKLTLKNDKHYPCAPYVRHPQFNQAQEPTTLPSDSSASVVNILMLRSRSVGSHPMHLSTTITSTLRFPPTASLYLVIRIIFPHSGLSFGFELVNWESHNA